MASVLPPENATGNYVKVVQRIPVRLRFKPNQNGLDRLRPGMSVEPDVRIVEVNIESDQPLIASGLEAVP